MSANGLRRGPSGKTIAHDWIAEEQAAARRLRSARSRLKPIGIVLGGMTVVAVSGLAVAMQLKGLGWMQAIVPAAGPAPIRSAAKASPAPVPSPAQGEAKAIPAAAPLAPPTETARGERRASNPTAEAMSTAALAPSAPPPRVPETAPSPPPVPAVSPAPAAPPPVLSSPAPVETAPALASRSPSPTLQISREELRSLGQRAADLFSRGDVSGARLLLARAASSGDAKAKFALAETYDPDVLAGLKVRRIKGDPQRGSSTPKR
jgi:hypothetical protein